jgi:hypothetical protein
MKRRIRMLCRMGVATAALLAVAAPVAWSDDENEIPLDEAELFFELNHTDGDLGIHAVIDGEDWKRLVIDAPNDTVLLDVITRGTLRQHGLTELNFESAEPSFDELSPEEIFARFPEGVYDIEAVTLEGTELESEVELSHVMPAPPKIVTPAYTPCRKTPVVGTAPVTIDWNAVTKSHPSIGTPGQAIEVERYEVALERLDGDLNFFVELPPEVTAFKVPALFTQEAGVVKFEVLVKGENGNRTAVESCFRIR